MKWKIGDLLQYKSVTRYQGIPAYGVVIGYNQNREDNLWYTVHWFMNEENHRINAVKNKLAIEKICDNLNIPFWWYFANDHMTGQGNPPARDLRHCGQEAHEKFVRTMLNDQTQYA